MDRHRLGVTLFLVAALVSFMLSIGLWFTDNRDEGVFVGLITPSGEVELDGEVRDRQGADLSRADQQEPVPARATP